MYHDRNPGTVDGDKLLFHFIRLPIDKIVDRLSRDRLKNRRYENILLGAKGIFPSIISR